MDLWLQWFIGHERHESGMKERISHIYYVVAKSMVTIQINMVHRNDIFSACVCVCVFLCLLEGKQ